MKFTSKIGVEIHAQLLTEFKLFSDAKIDWKSPINTNVSLFDSGTPGTLPALNWTCVKLALRAAGATGCTLARRLIFDRKHYEHWDLPVGYQITQKREPIGINGKLLLKNDKIIRIKQIHLEQDTGKSFSSSQYHGVDLNRAGIGLIELVSEPDISSPVDAALFTQKCHELLQDLKICTGNLEEGAMRIDVNVNLIDSESGNALTPRVELKNINGISVIESAVSSEINRQLKLLKDGKIDLKEETRFYSPEKDETIFLRLKSSSASYRFLPEYDLPEYNLEAQLSEEEVLLTRDERVKLIISNYPQLIDKDEILLRLWTRPNLLPNLFQEALKHSLNPLFLLNWFVGEILFILNSCPEVPEIECKFSGKNLAQLVDGVKNEKIDKEIAKLEIFTALKSFRDIEVGQKLIPTENDIIETVYKAIDQLFLENPDRVKFLKSPQGQEKGSSNDAMLLACTDIVSELIAGIKAGKTVHLNGVRSRVSSKFKLSTQPKLVDIIAAIPEQYKSDLLPLLKAKPVRTASGVAVVAVMCKPHRCPHIAMTGNVCVYCPGGPDSDFEYSTQAYTGYEPTSMRAIRARYNPYEQARNRIEQLEGLGHSVDKVEYIIMGGTFMALDEDYRDYFVRRLHDALTGHTSQNVDEAVEYSEQSPVKCVGITIETRPDYCLKPHLSQMLRYGCTRLEIGVQSVFEDVARDTNRGHTVRAVCESFQLAKDCGFKVVAHMMPDLPNVGLERDLFGFREYFENPMFRSDGLKIYPTLVIRGTGLYELWKTRRYKNYPPDILIDLVSKIMALVPPWTRVYRVQRDIPMPLVTSGVEHGNLRELVLARMKDLGLDCRDVRSREVGIADIHHKIQPDAVELIRRDYVANGGWETFLSYEDPRQDILIGLLRLRRCNPSTTFRPELKSQSSSIVRELHVYGSVVPVHSRDPRKFQHQGYGTLLMEEAERIARDEHGSEKLAVIAGVGTRHYYRKLGYYLDGPYMSKML